MARTSKKLTLTTAQSQSGVIVLLGETNASNARVIPYVERYQAATGLMESPIEHLQKAARDESKRTARR